MRLGLVIVLLAGTAVALVHIRRAEIGDRHEIQRLQMRQVKLRRRLWDQQIRLGLFTTPEEIRRRIEEMKLRLVVPEAPEPVGAPSARSPRRPR